MKKLIFIVSLSVIFFACGEEKPKTPANPGVQNQVTTNVNPAYDPQRGAGKFTKVELDKNLDVAMSTKGEKAFGLKCSGCHKVTSERLVGPGWKGVTSRFSPEWIMNFMTNTNEMLDKDPQAQAQLEICLVRMPNQNLSDEDARALYEFMRKNDGLK